MVGWGGQGHLLGGRIEVPGMPPNRRGEGPQGMPELRAKSDPLFPRLSPPAESEQVRGGAVSTVGLRHLALLCHS